MAPTTKSRQRQFADLQDRPVKDIDPENEALPPSDSDSGDSDAEKAETKAATDHYVSVGKSKLRAGKDSTAALGPQYRGARVSRADLEAASEEDEEEEEEEEDNFEDAREELGSGGSSSGSGSGDEVFDDPETADLEADQDDRDVEIDSDDAFGESDEERFKDFTFRGSSKVLPGGKGKRVPRATAADFLGSDEEGEEESEDGEGDSLNDSDGESLDGEEGDSDDEMVDEERRNLIDDEAEESDEEEEEDGDLDGFIVDSDEDDEDEDEDGESGEDEDDDDDEDMDEEEEEERKPSRNAVADRSDIAALVAAGNKSVTVSLSEGQQKDIAKGNAIRQQRKAFDALLNVRIRLQKSLVAINTLNIAAEGADAEDTNEPPYEAAEAAALKLWNAIDSFRSNLPGAASSSSTASKKRKRSAAATPETPSQQIWESIEAAEQRAAPRRRAVLQNWSQKANNIRTVDRSSARKFSTAAEKTLVARLDEEMEAPERLIKRTRTPRSCAPAQVARKVNEDVHIYDDADFYQLLLKELVDQRTADTSAGGAAGSAAATIRFAAVREAKAKKHVDTKASKGRKMRFNVHDKLQNFMAPEDRRSWEQSAIDRLFGTLFGQKMALNEDDISEDDEMDGGVDAEEAGLRLFRS
ncbi:apoptosis-antagonizing transcription factor [Microdochium trichocladiopsis]|uniref:Protein BFR2 n=1 Tax=Microdochium trichocladiopsis TaxID=1682393 RepID=A0A9P8XVV6_9PEZI|nr:apoptosis-antagonizing transcription factor [Microdochium trichocladiopsis]KAH7020886.1 apoptosis-antagonizing transcription factor [Microdochium trichocladiopsis]